MIIFLYGEDEWRKIQKKKELIANFQNTYKDIFCFTFDLDETPQEFFLEEIKSQFIFEKPKLIVVYNLFLEKNKNLAQEIRFALSVPNLTLLIQEKNSPPKEFDFLLKKPVIFEEFKLLSGKKWQEFALNEIKKRNINLTPDALNILIQSYESNSFAFITELEKLSFLNKKINASFLYDLNIDIQPNFWGIFNDLKSFKIEKRLKALETLFNLKEPPGKIFNILAYNWNEKIQNFALYDKAIKSGKLDYEEALLDAILS